MKWVISILFLSFLSMSCCRQERKMVEELTLEEKRELPPLLFRLKEIRIVNIVS